jgi:hypothetical protein
MSKEDIRARIIAHNNQFAVGDTINFSFLESEGEAEGKLIQIIDCKYGLVETKWGTFKAALSLARIIQKGESDAIL